MYTFSILSVLLATAVVAVPNPIVIPPRPHICPSGICHGNVQIAALKRGISYSSAAYSVFQEATGTTTVTIIVTATATASTITPTPTVPSFTIPEPVEERAGVYICDDKDWGGKCEHHLSPLGSADDDCTQLDGKASSIGPDVGFHCLFFTNAYCRPLASNGTDTLSLEYPGTPNLQLTGNGGFNDKLYSYLCFKIRT